MAEILVLANETIGGEKLLDAIRATRKSRILRTALGDEVIDSYTKLKLRQWDGYSAAIFPWEREQTLDC